MNAATRVFKEEPYFVFVSLNSIYNPASCTTRLGRNIEEYRKLIKNIDKSRGRDQAAKATVPGSFLRI